MKHFISPTGSLFAYESDCSQDHLIPADFVIATPEQIDAIQNPPPKPLTVVEQLAALDAQNQLTQRNLRETVMLMAEAFKTVTNGDVDLSTIPGVAKVYSVEEEAKALRALL